LVPFTNTNLEPGMVMIRPRGSTPHFHRLGNYGQGELSLDEVAELACRADRPDAQALVLSCTDMSSVEVIERIESRLGKAVITSNQAMMFCVVRTQGLEHQDNCPGQLFDLLND
jgi:maleate isomerase|tara:strand:+ start:3164 stop:3505 length:342 start_codon:yes stop_codon:yes gene_type:complete